MKTNPQTQAAELVSAFRHSNHVPSGLLPLAMLRAPWPGGDDVASESPSPDPLVFAYSSKKLVVTSATLVVTSALLVVKKSY